MVFQSHLAIQLSSHVLPFKAVVENPTRGLFEPEEWRGEAPLPQGPSNVSSMPSSKVETGLSSGPKATGIPPLAAVIARLSRPNKSLIRAIDQSDYSKAHEILNDESKLAWISAETFGRALCLAATHGDELVVNLLLEKGADVDAPNPNSGGERPLWIASNRGNEQAVRLLLEKAADVNAVDIYNQSSLLVASRAGRERIVVLLLEKGADVNAADIWDQSSLLVASREGHEQIVRLLLENGADMKGAWEAASLNGRSNIVQLLKQHTSKLDRGNQAVMEIVKFYQEHDSRDSDVWAKIDAPAPPTNQPQKFVDVWDSWTHPVSRVLAHSLRYD
jgi:hypothetical protein